jgi:hypothetical protein
LACYQRQMWRGLQFAAAAELEAQPERFSLPLFFTAIITQKQHVVERQIGAGNTQVGQDEGNLVGTLKATSILSLFYSIAAFN